jgi:hypothetical protein
MLLPGVPLYLVTVIIFETKLGKFEKAFGRSGKLLPKTADVASSVSGKQDFCETPLRRAG